MSWKTSIPIGVGIFLAVIAASVIGAAMILTDKGEELVHLYGDYRATQGGNNKGALKSSQMELLGKWQGLSLAAVDGKTAASLGIRDKDNGVVVAGIAPAATARAQQGGLQMGDVITGVDNQPVKNLADLYNASRKVNPATPTVMEVQRQGQTVALVLPPATQAGMGFGQPRGEVENAWGAGVPAAWNGQNSGSSRPFGALRNSRNSGSSRPFGALRNNRNFYCPRDGTVLPRGSVSRPFLCPRCRGPLHLYPPGLR